MLHVPLCNDAFTDFDCGWGARISSLSDGLEGREDGSADQFHDNIRSLGHRHLVDDFEVGDRARLGVEDSAMLRENMV